MSEDLPPAEVRPSPSGWGLKAAAFLSLLGPTLLVLGVAFYLLPFGLLLAGAYVWYCSWFLKNLDSKHGLARAIGTGLLTVLFMLAGATLATEGFSTDDPMPWVLAAVLVLIPVALVAMAVKSYYVLGREPGDGWTLAGGLAASLIYGVLVLLPASVVLPGLLRSRIASNQAIAVGALRAVNVCAAAYLTQHPDRGYPADLAALGPSAEKCIDAQLASGKKSGYGFSYLPGPRDGKGRIETYSITARPTKIGTTGIVSYFSNSTHFIRSTHEDRSATAADSPLAP